MKPVLYTAVANFFVFALSLPLATTAFCQSESNSQTAQPDSNKTSSKKETIGITFSDPTEVFWEFGFRITAKGEASRISATTPIPMEWPEQTVEVIGEEKSDVVGRISIKNLTKSSRQMHCKINRLKSGQIAEAIVRVKITKSHIHAPADPSQLRIAKKIPSNLKQYLKPSPYIESSHTRIKKIAEQIGVAEGLSDWEKVESIYKWVRDNVEYKFDTQIHSCLDALDAGQGDCEELSSLFIAICRAKGIPARAVWIPGHTYPEFYLTDAEGNDHWIPCQVAGSYEFGAMTDSRPILQKGDRFKLPGHPKPFRYIRPNLVARDSTAALGFEWINRETEGKESKLESSGRDR